MYRTEFYIIVAIKALRQSSRGIKTASTWFEISHAFLPPAMHDLKPFIDTSSITYRLSCPNPNQMHSGRHSFKAEPF